MDGLKKLLAIHEIEVLKARYFRGCDTRDRSLLTSLFMEDATADYRGGATDPRTGSNPLPSTDVEVLHGRDQIVEFIMDTVVNKLVATVHHGCCPEIEITNDETASGLWPFVDRLTMPPGGPFNELVGYGHYHETYRQEHGNWKIHTLRITRLRVDNN